VAPEVLSANDTKKEYQVLPADVGKITPVKNFVIFTFVLLGICFSEGLERLSTGGTRSNFDPSSGQCWTFSYLCLLTKGCSQRTDPLKTPDPLPGELLMLAVPQFEQLLAQMMDVIPAKRPTASEALEGFRSLREQIPDRIRFAPHDGYDKELFSEFVPPEKMFTMLREMLIDEHNKREFGRLFGDYV